MKKERKKALAKEKQDTEIALYLQDGFDSVMNIIEEKGFQGMVQEGIIVRTDVEYKV